uniref:Uncharacterized protein n=1 Tax=Salix viminalis TaxID=40686 RepID=A0A6N2LPI7_SALVM
MTTLQDSLLKLQFHKGIAAATMPTPNMNRVLCTIHVTEPEVSSGIIGLSSPSSFLGCGGAGAGARVRELRTPDLIMAEKAPSVGAKMVARLEQTLQLVAVQWLRPMLSLVLQLVAGIVFGSSGGREGQRMILGVMSNFSCANLAAASATNLVEKWERRNDLMCVKMYKLAKMREKRMKGKQFCCCKGDGKVKITKIISEVYKQVHAALPFR